jgi:hypothetical protein
MSEQDARDELEAGKDELRRLMDSIWRAEYRNDAPDWKPLDDLVGMVSQIDNMYAGVRGQRDQARWDLHNPKPATAPIDAPLNGEPDPEWRAIRRAIDQFVGRVPVISKHRAVHNTTLAETVARLDAAGDREAADTIVWLCWFRALDRERERFLLADAAESRTLATTPARNTSQIGEG